jgi:hypothetical protein
LLFARPGRVLGRADHEYADFVIVPFVVAALLLQAPAPGAPVPPLPDQPPTAPAPVDPATVTFTTGVGLLLVAVKPDRTADYEEALVALQGALSAAAHPGHRAVAAGWRVFKASETDAKGNVLYVHALLPVVEGVDYRPSLWLDELLEQAPTELLAKYRDAFATPPTKLSLTELANMALAPVKK